MDDVVVPEEWKENFRMRKENFLKLCAELRPFIEKQVTNMREPVEVEKGKLQQRCTICQI